jgi:Kef-type K+ transport system membrane component KefB
MDLNFLPTLPLQVNRFALFGSILLLGLVGGELAHRSRAVPRVTGFLLIGLGAGPNGLGLLSYELMDQALPFVDIALGIVLFQLGMKLDLETLRRDRSLLASGMLESGLSFLLMYAVLTLLGVDGLHAGLAAAIGISSSPAVVLLVTRELRATGPVTGRCLDLVALNNVLSFLVFTGILPWLHYEQHAAWSVVILQPLYRLFGSLALACLLTGVCLLVARLIGQRENGQFALLVGTIVSAVGAAKMLDLSPLLVLLALGILSRNLDRDGVLMEVEFGHSGDIFFVILFVVAGASLHLKELSAVGWAAAALVVARLAGKTAALILVSRHAGLSLRQSSLLGLTLVPMAGLAIGLVQTTSNMYPEFAEALSAMILASVAILETVGPVATEFALKRAGEVAPDADLSH